MFKNNVVKESNNPVSIWFRLGATLLLTKAEAKKVLTGETWSEEIIKNAINEGRWTLDGETYIPQIVVEDTTVSAGLDIKVPENDIEFNFSAVF